MQPSSTSGLRLNGKTRLVTYLFMIIHFPKDVDINLLSPALDSDQPGSVFNERF